MRCADYVQRYAKPEDVEHLDDGGRKEGEDADMSEGEGGSDGYLSSSSEEEEIVGRADD